MVQDATTPGSARSRAFLHELLAAASRAEDVMSAWFQTMEPDCVVHTQNGDRLSHEQGLQHTTAFRGAFPDLMMEVDHALFPDDRLVLQLTMTGAVAPGIPLLPAGYRIASPAALIARPSARLRMAEVWSYVNPGFPFAYPGKGVHVPPPPDDGAGAAEAYRLYEAWTGRAEAGADFITAIASTFAPDGVVHLGNGDCGRADALTEVFQRVAIGLPDLSLRVDEVAEADGRLIVQFLMSGTHRGHIGPYPPSGKVLPSRGLFIARADRQARVAEMWVYLAPAYSLSLPPAGGLESGR